MTSNALPHLTADDEPTARITSLSMIAHPEPMVLPVVCCADDTLRSRVSRLVRRIRVAIADFVLGDVRWDEKRVLTGAVRQYELERVWDRDPDGDPLKLRAWKDSQLELEHATHALLVARGKK